MRSQFSQSSAGRVLGGILAALTLITVVGCGSGGSAKPPVDHFGYAVGSPLLTTNASTMLGASTNADILGGRVFPPVFIIGPQGQMIPNRDLATAQAAQGPELTVNYEINPKAEYSDGQPVTCTDFLLAYKAGVMKGLFNSRMPLMQQVSSLDCNAGEKNFTVHFHKDLGARWRSLFGPGAVVPSHVIAKRAGLSEEQLVEALQAENSAVLMPVAQQWRYGFDLKNFDPELQVSAGPYKIQDVGANGEVQLVRNDLFNGDKATIEKVMMWPKSANLDELNNGNNVEVADLVGQDDVSWVHKDDPQNRFKVEHVVGHLTEQLSLGNAGVFADSGARRAFAACVDRPAVAEASSSLAGVKVPPVATHLTTSSDPVNTQLQSIVAAHQNVNLPDAEPLRGKTIRIGYIAPDERKKAMVAAIAKSCEPAGITVVDASSENQAFEDLHRMQQTPSGVDIEIEGTIDALLLAVDPHLGYGHINGDLGDVEKLQHEEEQLWNESDAIPLASQPRTVVYDNKLGNVVVNTASSGIGWNMERWQEGTKP